MNRLIGIVLCIAMVHSAAAQDARYVKFKKAATYAPRNIYVSEIVDDRDIKDNVGTIRHGKGHADLLLQGGIPGGLLPVVGPAGMQSGNKQAVSMHITRLTADMSRGVVVSSGTSDMAVVFYVAGNKVMEYSMEGEVQREPDVAAYMGDFIASSISGFIEKFDHWWQLNSGKVAVSNDMQVNVKIGTTIDADGCFAWSAQRPLRIADFRGAPDNNVVELAATYSGIGFKYSGGTQDSHLVLNVVITPYFDGGRSWFKEQGKTPQVLAHEQTHFNITVINAYQFAAAVKAANFTKDDHDDKLKQLQQKYWDANSAEQDQYDTETNHGTIRDKQIQWEQKIAAQLAAITKN
jgi:hypothetical protein